MARVTELLAAVEGRIMAQLERIHGLIEGQGERLRITEKENAVLRSRQDSQKERQDKLETSVNERLQNIMSLLKVLIALFLGLIATQLF